MSEGVPAGGKLEACPFCDGVAVSARCDRQERATFYRVFCLGCPAMVEAVTRDKAITAWNTRATPTPPIEGRDADVERVEVVAKAIYDATHVGLSNCYAWDDEWEPHQEARRGRYYKEAAAAIAALQALGERP